MRSACLDNHCSYFDQYKIFRHISTRFLDILYNIFHCKLNISDISNNMQVSMTLILVKVIEMMVNVNESQ